MLAAIGVESVDDLFDQVPEPLRLDRPLDLPEGKSEAEVHELLSGLATRNSDAESAGLLHRRRDVRPLRAGDRRRDHPALRVPDPLHALPAGDLAGRAAGDVRVPDRDVGADRAAGLERRALRGAVLGRLGRVPGDGGDRAVPLRGLARGAPAQPRDALDLLPRVRLGGGRGRTRRRPHRPCGARRRGRRRDRRGDSCRARTSSARSRTSRRSAPRRRRTGRCWWSSPTR